MFTYKLKPKNSVILSKLVDIILLNESLIEDNYNDKDDQFLIPKKLFAKIYDFVKNIKNEKINKKELVKYAVREAFELKESDIVIIQKEKIFIKLFEVKKVIREETKKNKKSPLLQ